MNNSGKALTVFLIVIAILLVSITAIALFYLTQEIEVRKALELNFEQVQLKETQLQDNLKEANKKIYLLEEKIKESEEQIESLQGELDLAEGLREEIKKENRDLKKGLDDEKQAKTKLQEDFDAKLAETEKKISGFQEDLKSAVNRNKELDAQRQNLQDNFLKLKNQLEEKGITPVVTGDLGIESQGLVPTPGASIDENVQLETIVVSPNEPKQGKVISVDKDTDFVIVNLGEKDGVAAGIVLSIYRGKEYLGDVKVSRVLPEMSAADFIPPLKSLNVQKDDQVIIKK